jgi:hypothetical protein
MSTGPELLFHSSRKGINFFLFSRISPKDFDTATARSNLVSDDRSVSFAG